MVVEDQSVQRRIAVAMLKSLGVAAVEEAEDGYVALDLLGTLTRPVDVIVCDLKMPRMDGIEFLSRLGELQCKAAVILASMLEEGLISAVEAMARAQGLTVLGRVPKPLSMDSLGEMLKRYSRAAGAPRNSGPPPTREDLEEGIAEREFVAFFQPKVHIESGEVRGAEALARWRHPERGLVPPGLFIPLAEKCGLIDALTWVMLTQSMEQSVRMKHAGLDPSIAINLSAHYLQYQGVADRIAGLAERYGVEPRHVILEVTESLAATKIGTAIANLVRLRMKGFGIAIDDYGTGYASLEQLSRIPFSELKIDRGFVDGAARQTTLRAILGSSVELARQLRLTSVAEGVETRADYAVLEEVGCDYAQGFLIARPMAAEELVPWAERWQG